MKRICVVGIALHKEAQKILEKVYCVEGMDAIKEAEAALVYTVPDEWIEKAEKLRAVGCHSCSPAFVEWAEKKGIAVIKAQSLWRTVAEHTLALAMAAARWIPQADHAVRIGEWKDHETLKIQYSGRDLQKRVFGIWGMGQIGRELASLFQGFSMEVLYSDIRPLSPEEEKRWNVSRVEFRELLERSDYFCVLVPHNASTDQIFGKEAFSSMKKGCIFINTARAGIVDRAAFVQAMENGILGAAALDVTWEEAKPQPEDLLRFKNLIFTPHLGGSTFECDAFLVRGILDAAGFGEKTV